MLNYIEPHIAEELLKARVECTALNLALNNTKKMKLNIKDTSPLRIRKAKAEVTKKELEFKALSGLVTENIVLLKDNWYAIAYYLNKKNRKNNIRSLFITPIKSEYKIDDIKKKLAPLYKNNRNELQNPASILKGIMDNKKINKYKSEINKISLLALEKLMKKDSDEELSSKEFALENIQKDNKNFIITRHAYQRWCERIEKFQCDTDKKTFLKINNVETKKDIIPKITSAFKKSEKIYEKVDDDNIQYYLNKENMIFFCVKDNNLLITIWQNNFGFTNEINTQITLMQLKHIQDMKLVYFENRKKNNEIIAEKNAKITVINSELEDLKQRKNELEKNILAKESTKLNYEQEITGIQEEESLDLTSLSKEENKILKKYSVNNSYNDMYGLDELVLLKDNNLNKLTSTNINLPDISDQSSSIIIPNDSPDTLIIDKDYSDEFKEYKPFNS